MNVYKRLGPADIDNRRRHVDIKNLLFYDCTGFDKFGIANDQWDTDALFVHGSLVDHTVFAKQKRIIARKDDERIIKLADLFERPVNLAYAVIDRVDCACITPDERSKNIDALGTLVREIFAESVERPVDAVPRIKPLSHPFRLCFQIKTGLGIRNRDIVVGVFIFFFGDKGTVGGLVPQDQHERLVGFAFVLQPVSSHIGYARSIITFDQLSRSIDIEGRVVVFALALMCDPVIEAGASFIILFAHVPFAYIGSVVAGFLKAARVTCQIGGIVRKVIHHAVRVGIQPGKERCPARRAKRSRDEHILEQSSFSGQPIQVGSFHAQQRFGHNTDAIPSLVICKDNDDIWAVFAAG